MNTEHDPAVADRRTHEDFLTMERWLPVPGFEGMYEVSDMGRVRSWKRWGVDGARILKPHPDGDGYLKVALHRDSKRFDVAIHRLVPLAFIGPPPQGHEVRHLDGDPANNHLSNLRYGTQFENAQDRVAHGRDAHARRAHCKSGHEFSEANTRITRDGWRSCRTCHRNWARDAWRAKRKALVG
jgi:hypothetical protein